jgi:serine/threonine-protein kinase
MTSPVNPGDILMEKFRVDRLLGMGGMGVVVAATHIGLQQRVAIKFMLANKVAAREQYERFLREARAAVRLKSEHVARVSDVGTMETGAPYMVMEYLEGRDLSAVLADGGPLPIAEAVDHILQACEAVGEAHAAGIIHRDLKPANLFLTTSAGGADCIKVLDFGISKTSDSELALTHEAAILGSPLYMSPEQMRASKDADARADIWSLGVVIYQLLTGTTPFHADQMQALCARVFFGEPTPITTLRAEVPPGLEATILQCLEKDRARRWRNVAELAAALAPFGSARASGYAERVAGVLGMQVEPSRATNVLPGAPAHVPVPGPGPASALGSGTLQTSVLGQTGHTPPTAKRGPVVVAALGAVLLVVAAGGVARWGSAATVKPATPGAASVLLSATPLETVPPATAPMPAPDASISAPPAASSVAVAPAPAPTAAPSGRRIGAPTTKPTRPEPVVRDIATAKPAARPPTPTNYEKD